MEPPAGVRVLEHTPSGVVVEFDEPCTDTCAREGTDYTLTVVIHAAGAWHKGEEIEWCTVLCALYKTSLGAGANVATVGEAPKRSAAPSLPVAASAAPDMSGAMSSRR